MQEPYENFPDRKTTGTIITLNMRHLGMLP